MWCRVERTLWDLRVEEAFIVKNSDKNHRKINNSRKDGDPKNSKNSIFDFESTLNVIKFDNRNFLITDSFFWGSNK